MAKLPAAGPATEGAGVRAYTREEQQEIVEHSFEMFLNASPQRQQKFLTDLRPNGLAAMAIIYERLVQRQQQIEEVPA